MAGFWSASSGMQERTSVRRRGAAGSLSFDKLRVSPCGGQAQALEEVVTLPEAVALAGRLGYPLDRSNLLRYARSGRLIARKSRGTWLTTRSALKALVVELALQPRGRPRAAEPAWATVEPSPDLAATLAEINVLKAQVAASERSAADAERLRRELTVEAIYHTIRAGRGDQAA